MVLRGQKSCLKHPMTITDTFREKYFEVKYESSEIVTKTLFFWKITRLGVTKNLAAELAPGSFWGPGVLDVIHTYSLVAGILEKTLWTQNFENRIFEIFHLEAYNSDLQPFCSQKPWKIRWKLIFSKSPQMPFYTPLKLSKLLSEFLSGLGTAPRPSGESKKCPGKSDFFRIFRKILGGGLLQAWNRQCLRGPGLQRIWPLSALQAHSEARGC